MSHNLYESPEYRSNNERSTPNIDYVNPDFYNHREAASAYTPNPYDANSSLYTQQQAYKGPQSYDEYTAAQEAQQRAAREAQEGKEAEGKGQARKGITGIATLAAVVGSWLLKLKGLAIFLKFGTTGFTAILAAAVYAIAFGWPFAIGLVASIFIHEMGHALVMKLKGIPVGSMIFIPMLGAFVSMKEMPVNAKDEAEVAIAGPIAGALAASFCLIMAQLGMGSIWAPLAYFGFFMNLFNLMPIVPFDGGRVLAAIDRRIWILGFVGLLGYQIWAWINGHFYLWLLIFVLFAAGQLWTRGLQPTDEESRAYYDVPVFSRILLTVLYFGLAAVLFMGMTLSHELMPINVGY